MKKKLLSLILAGTIFSTVVPGYALASEMSSQAGTPVVLNSADSNIIDLRSSLDVKSPNLDLYQPYGITGIRVPISINGSVVTVIVEFFTSKAHMIKAYADKIIPKLQEQFPRFRDALYGVAAEKILSKVYDLGVGAITKIKDFTVTMSSLTVEPKVVRRYLPGGAIHVPYSIE